MDVQQLEAEETEEKRVSSELKSQIESDPNGYAAFHLHIDHFTREQLLELVR
jgi:hypothetical protein